MVKAATLSYWQNAQRIVTPLKPYYIFDITVFIKIGLSPLGIFGLCLLHIFGVLFIGGRVLHAQAILSNSIKKRLYGMQITVVSIATLASANIALYLAQLLTVSRCIKAPSKNAL